MGGGDESCASRAVKAGLAGAAAGSAVGAASATWSAEAPVVVGGRSMPALLRTGRVMGATAASFGLVGAVFACVDCAVEGMRGKHDAWNAAAGGAAAGAALGVRLGRTRTAVAAAVALAGVAAAVEAGGRHVVADPAAMRARMHARLPPLREE